MQLRKIRDMRIRGDAASNRPQVKTRFLTAQRLVALAVMLLAMAPRPLGGKLLSRVSLKPTDAIDQSLLQHGGGQRLQGGGFGGRCHVSRGLGHMWLREGARSGSGDAGGEEDLDDKVERGLRRLGDINVSSDKNVVRLTHVLRGGGPSELSPMSSPSGETSKRIAQDTMKL